MQDETRRCGKCGGVVNATDISCPHCGALLAAYEAPAGSISGTASAVTPISVPVEPASPEPATIPEPVEMRPAESEPEPKTVQPYESPTAKSLDDLDGERPKVSATSSSLAPDSESPIMQSLKETRIAADLDEPESDEGDDDDNHHDPPVPSGKPIGLAEAREALGLSPEPQIAEPEPKPEPDKTVQEAATSQPRPARPAPEKRGSRSGPPVPQRTISNANARPRPQKPSQTTNQQSNKTAGFSVQAIIGILIFFVVVIPAMRSGAFSGVLIIFIVVAGLILYMKTLAKNTGRKTTNMPRNKHPRT